MSTQPIRRFRGGLNPKTAGTLLMVLAELFVLGSALTLHFAPSPPSLTLWQLAIMVGGWTAAWLGVYAVVRKHRPGSDPLIVPIAAFLTGWGLVLQARLAPRFMLRQVLWLVLGCGLLCALTLTSELSRLLRRYRYTLLTGGIFLLAATLVFGVNPSGYGQRLWLGFQGVYIQPSEVLKLLLVIYLAAYLSDRRDLMRTGAEPHARPLWLVVLGPMLAMVGLALLLVGWQQDLGAAVLFYLTFVTMIHLAWGQWRYTALSLLFFVPVVIAGYLFSSRVAHRVSIWLNPWAPEQADRAFQILQSLFALGAGGIIGQGLGQGAPTLIPAVHTDFVFSALVEEFGLAGGIALILLIAALVQRGVRLAKRSGSPFESLLAGGLTALLCIQSWVIIAGNIKLIPITGVTLPYLSYGGSSLLTTLAATGILLNLSAPHPQPLALSLSPGQMNPPSTTVGHFGRGLLGLLLSVAVFSGVWTMGRREDLNTYPSNPRPIMRESRIRRGTIFDRRGQPLAQSSVDPTGYVERRYPVPEAAPVVGYATLDYGTEGIEDVCDARLRGDETRTDWEQAVDELLHRAPEGQNVRLSIDVELQILAQDLLKDQEGAAVLVDARTGEVLALASSPTFAPGSVVEDWEALRNAEDAPLLNRATRGLAQPGLVIAPVILAEAWEEGAAIAPSGPLTSSIQVDGSEIGCTRSPQGPGWQSVLAAQCPAPIARAAETLTDTTLTQAFGEWGLLDAPPFTLPTVAVDEDPSGAEGTQEAIGQGALLVTPLQIVRVSAAIANDGVIPPLHLIDGAPAGCNAAAQAAEARVLSPDLAEALREVLPRYGQSVGVLAHALAGPDRVQSWFTGLNSENVPRYAVAVLIDQTTPNDQAAEIGRSLLAAVSDLKSLSP